MTGHKPSILVIIPAHNAAWCLADCLAGLAKAGFDLTDEVVVVDDGSTDETGQCASDFGARLVTHPTPLGAAAARQAGAKDATADILLFVDADVVPSPDTKDRVLGMFTDQPDCAALFGAYDDNPAAPAWVSQYRNLLHRHVHLTGARISQTFWTGLGAVRRAVYEAVGGIDPAQRMMEDVEFGLRISKAGHRILLCPEITGQHLKHWGWRSMAKTDLFDRAIPWSRLLAQHKGAFGDLNLSQSRQAAALASVAVGLGLVLMILWPKVGLGVLLIGLTAFIGLNWSFLRWLSNLRGPSFAAFAVLPHLLHNWCAILGFAFVRMQSLATKAHP